MEEIKISIIIPVYNCEKYLDRCLKSVTEQTHKNLEILVIDDGSKDKSGEICDKWAKRDSRITVIHKENGGVSSARNAGLDAATGDYVGFVDADDWIEPDMYEFLLKNAKKYDADVTDCCFYLNYPSGKEVCTENFEDIVITDPDECFNFLLHWSGTNIWNKLYKKHVLSDLYFDQRISYAEDYLFNIELCAKCVIQVFARICAPKYHYCITSTSSSKAINNANYSFLDVYQKIISFPQMLNKDNYTFIRKWRITNFYTNYYKFTKAKNKKQCQNIRKTIRNERKEWLQLNLDKLLLLRLNLICFSPPISFQS